MLIYNPTTVERFEGTITSIDQARPGVHLTLKTEEGSFSVRLGPAWYVAEQNVVLGVGDHIVVTGSRVNSTIIAAKVRKGNHEMILRNLNGIPRWAGQQP